MYRDNVATAMDHSISSSRSDNQINTSIINHLVTMISSSIIRQRGDSHGPRRRARERAGGENERHGIDLGVRKTEEADSLLST